MIRYWLRPNPEQDQPVRLPHTILAAFAALFAVPILCLALAFLLRSLGAQDLPDSTLSEATKWLFLGSTSFILSWIGFLLLVPGFLLLAKTKIHGWLPTTILGAMIGTIVIAFFAGSTLDADDTAPFAVFGALHALGFWIAYNFITKITS